MTSEYDYTIWAGDTDEISVTLADKNGAVNLTGATIVTVIEGFTGSPKHEISCTGNSSGVVTVPLTATHTETAGMYYFQLQVTVLGERVTFPSAGPRKIIIQSL